jgi:hypothetical protein
MQLVIATALFIAGQALIGPTLTPALGSIGLVVLVFASCLLQEKLTWYEYLFLFLNYFYYPFLYSFLPFSISFSFLFFPFDVTNILRHFPYDGKCRVARIQRHGN